MSIDYIGTPENAWQRIQAETNDVISPGNLIDGVALGMAAYAAPRFDTTEGIVIGGLAYSADFVDGLVARRTGTASELGAKVDATGDKVKIAWAIYHTWKLDLAPRTLLLAIAARNGLNAAITGADRAINVEPVLTEPEKAGKRSIAMEVAGVGLNIIGNKVEKNNPGIGRAMRYGGTALAAVGNIYGYKSTVSYAVRTLAGNQKPWVRRLVGAPGISDPTA